MNSQSTCTAVSGCYWVTVEYAPYYNTSRSECSQCFHESTRYENNYLAILQMRGKLCSLNLTATRKFATVEASTTGCTGGHAVDLGFTCEGSDDTELPGNNTTNNNNAIGLSASFALILTLSFL